MASATAVVIKLSELGHGQEAVCFAALVKKERGTDKYDKPFVKCHFRDRKVLVIAPLWAEHALREASEAWAEGQGFRLHVVGDHNPRYGMQVKVLDARPAGDEDAEDGYDFYDLVECSDQDPEELFRKVKEYVESGIKDAPLKRLVLAVLSEHAELFKKMPAATQFHHAYTAGLLEHVWSMARVACWMADHYGRYYHQLNPPLNKGIVLAATVLHDIGKLRELNYSPVEATYTKVGALVGHVLMGRDMVRDAASRIDGFPAETLLLLEHAILAHHGRKEFGAPVVPQTIEALLVSHIDDLDAKMNQAARALLKESDGDFTDKVYPLDNRRLYRGTPVEALPDDDPSPLD